MNSICCHKQNDSPNSNDLSSFLKVVNDGEVERRAGGKLFHAHGPATANSRSPMDARRVDGTTRSEVDAERSRRRAALATDTVRSDKYPGAAPFRHPCTSTHNLYWMRCGQRWGWKTPKTPWRCIASVCVAVVHCLGISLE